MYLWYAVEPEYVGSKTVSNHIPAFPSSVESFRWELLPRLPHQVQVELRAVEEI